MRLAIRAAESDDTAASRFAPKKMRAQHPGLDAELQVEPVGHEALRDEATRERVEGEQRRQLQHHAPRAAQSEDLADAVVAGSFAWRRLDRGAEPREPEGKGDADDGVADHDRAVGIDRGRPRSSRTWLSSPAASAPVAVAT